MKVAENEMIMLTRDRCRGPCILLKAHVELVLMMGSNAGAWRKLNTSSVSFRSKLGTTLMMRAVLSTDTLLLVNKVLMHVDVSFSSEFGTTMMQNRTVD
jgi:hypothetical protein